jgi:hypothetical protein
MALLILSGALWKVIHEKTLRQKKSRDTIPLKYEPGNVIAGANPTAVVIQYSDDVRSVFG